MKRVLTKLERMAIEAVCMVAKQRREQAKAVLEECDKHERKRIQDVLAESDEDLEGDWVIHRDGDGMPIAVSSEDSGGQSS